MHTTEHKFAIGDNINLVYDKNIFGIVTAIWIRSCDVSYEIGYSDNGPKDKTVQECEIELCTKTNFGFAKKEN